MGKKGRNSCVLKRGGDQNNGGRGQNQFFLEGGKRGINLDVGMSANFQTVRGGRLCSNTGTGGKIEIGGLSERKVSVPTVGKGSCQQ